MADNRSDSTVALDDLLNDLTKADPLAENLGKRTADMAKRLGAPAYAANLIGAVAAASVAVTIGAASLVAVIFVGVGGKLVQIFLRILTKLRTDTVPEQVELAAAVLSEFLATEIDPAHMKPLKTGDQTIQAANAIGNALIERLTKEFAPNGTVTPESGEQAAKTFSGYGVNFAVQNTLISMLADASSFHFLEDWRELGVETARNLGLGRLVRQALAPLVRNTIAEPYDQQLRKKYHQDLLSEQHAVDAFYGGFITAEQVQETLARKGYSDELIRVVDSQLRKKLTADELETLLRAGQIGPEFAKAELRAAGYDDVKGDQKLAVQRIARTDSLTTTFKSLVTKQRIDGLIDEDAYNKLLDRLPISEEEKQLERNFVGASLEVPRSFLTWSEVTKAFELGAVDITYVDAWLQREGFSDDDALVKELLLFDALGKKLAKDQAAADRAARQSAK